EGLTLTQDRKTDKEKCLACTRHDNGRPDTTNRWVHEVANLESFDPDFSDCKRHRPGARRDNEDLVPYGRPLYRFPRSESFHSQNVIAPEITTATALPQSGI